MKSWRRNIRIRGGAVFDGIGAVGGIPVRARAARDACRQCRQGGKVHLPGQAPAHGGAAARRHHVL